MEGYKNLTTYILATVICDLNVEFISRNIDFRSRTKDQMEQAGRSGKHPINAYLLPRSTSSRHKSAYYGAGNIAEGYTLGLLGLFGKAQITLILQISLTIPKKQLTCS